ncbi:MAG: transketolase [Opitutales bacterium]
MSTTTADLPLEVLNNAAAEARGLSIDAVKKAGIGHLGLPLGCAEIGAVLWGAFLSYNPARPDWINRDRFVLSAGHGSMFLYGWLHLAGYDLPMEQVKNFRQLHSTTPGHPEFGETPGVEATTGPLGQGTGNLVGMAVAAKMAEALFNTSEHTILDHVIVGLAGDGCLQEGISNEAASFAGHNGLDNLIMIFDDNGITLDAAAEKTQSEDQAARYEAMGWETKAVDGHDMVATLEALEWARSRKGNGKPKLILANTLAGKGIAEVEGTSKAHGEGGQKFADTARKSLGLPEDLFYVSAETYQFFAEHKAQMEAAHAEWEKTYSAWRAANPEKAAILDKGIAGDHGTEEELLAAIPEFGEDYADATRGAGGKCIQPLAQRNPLLLSGSADLHGSTKNYIKDVGDFSKETPTGRNLYFGIREHVMGAMLNGFAYYGLFKASGATFCVFSDYMRPAVRLAALSHLPVVYIWTHDSVGVGEDGPTHQPVETVSALRCIPNLDVYRPGDPEETAAAFAAAFSRSDGPTGLVLTRQKVPTLSQISVEDRRAGALKGGYIAKKESGQLKLILIATGSELHLAMEAAENLEKGEDEGGAIAQKVSEKLAPGVRVVSMPCVERFERQDAAYKEAVLPPDCARRIAIEAGVSPLWWKYVGTHGKVLGIDCFGLSAPGATVMQELGMNSKAVVDAALTYQDII